MEASELRIGNWVKTCSPNMEIMIPHVFAQVQGITLFHDILFFHTPQVQGYEMPCKHIIGIPLTPEILEKAGFEEVGEGYFGGKKYIFSQFSFDFAGGHLDLSECIEGNYVNRKNIKYVHQLQNLYFALTGEELKIEL